MYNSAMNEYGPYETELIEKLVETLRELPEVDAQWLAAEVHEPDERKIIDAEIRLTVAGKEITLLVEAKKSAYPRDVREALWQLERLAHHTPNTVPLLAAESLSPGAKELLRKENVGYYDTGGSLFIPAHGAYFFVDKPPPKTLKKTVRSLFKGKRAQTMHALLVRHPKWINVKRLAELAKVSPTTASETLVALERFDWVRAKGQGPAKERHLVEPGALLDEWAKQLPATRAKTERRYYVPFMDTTELVRRLAAACEMHDATYVITGEAAAQEYTPFISSVSRVTCRLAPGRAAQQAIGELDARIVTEGTNLIVIETASQGEFLFRERKRDLWLASPIQVYLDLLRGDGRANDLARHLRIERIGY